MSAPGTFYFDEYADRWVGPLNRDTVLTDVKWARTRVRTLTDGGDRYDRENLTPSEIRSALVTARAYLRRMEGVLAAIDRGDPMLPDDLIPPYARKTT